MTRLVAATPGQRPATRYVCLCASELLGLVTETARPTHPFVHQKTQSCITCTPRNCSARRSSLYTTFPSPAAFIENAHFNPSRILVTNHQPPVQGFTLLCSFGFEAQKNNEKRETRVNHPDQVWCGSMHVGVVQIQTDPPKPAPLHTTCPTLLTRSGSDEMNQTMYGSRCAAPPPPPPTNPLPTAHARALTRHLFRSEVAGKPVAPTLESLDLASTR